MSVYVDANVLVALFVIDTHNERAEKAVAALRDNLVVSSLSAAEFSSVIARRVRTRDLQAAEARTAFTNFDTWCARYTRRTEIEGSDFATAMGLIRRLDLPLRTPDALHIAVAQRTGCALLTLDAALAKIAALLDVEVVRASRA